MARDRVLITVKTYPTLSKKYGETVCTAAVRDDGTWVRIYPVPYRRLDEEEQYKKYDWLECTLVRNQCDPRPETYRPKDPSELRAIDHVDTSDNWRERRRILLRTAKVWHRLEDLITAAKANEASLAVFKPTRVLDFVWEEDAREWDPERVRQMRALHSQMDLFEDNAWRETFQLIPKLPYSFSYRFQDAAGRTSELQVLDWETGQLYWNCLRSAEGDEPKALAKIREKYMDEFLQKDLHFYLGTTQQYHFVAPNPWVIVGVLPIPHERQLGLFKRF
jgi:hypothetical protein